uniref:Peptidase A2 domain-containing protein n=1 Tax=Ditylenchus dipsaci TaxID=166011 RepID=A0A915D6R3_9BILA
MKTVNMEPKINVPAAKATMMPATDGDQLEPVKEIGKFFGSVVADTDANVTVKERTDIAWANRVGKLEEMLIPESAIALTITKHLDGQTRPHVPITKLLVQVPVTVNDQKYLALIDSGSTITVAPEDVLYQLGLQAETVKMSVDAVTGHQLVINRKAKVNLTVAGETREITMYMTPDKAMGKRVAFDVIIEGDAMKKFHLIP